MSEVFSSEVVLDGYRVIYVATSEKVGTAMLGKDGTAIPRPIVQARTELAVKAMREWPRA